MSRNLYRRWIGSLTTLEYLQLRVQAKLQGETLLMRELRALPTVQVLRAGRLPKGWQLLSEGENTSSRGQLHMKAERLLKDAALAQPKEVQELIRNSHGRFNPLLRFVERQLDALQRGKSHEEASKEASELETLERQELREQLRAYASEFARKESEEPDAVPVFVPRPQHNAFRYFRLACMDVPYARWPPREQAYLDYWIFRHVLHMGEKELMWLILDPELHRSLEDLRTTMFKKARAFPAHVQGDSEAEAAFLLARAHLLQDPVKDLLGNNKELLEGYVAFLQIFDLIDAGRLTDAKYREVTGAGDDQDGSKPLDLDAAAAEGSDKKQAGAAASQKLTEDHYRDLEDWVADDVIGFQNSEYLLDVEFYQRVEDTINALFPALDDYLDDATLQSRGRGGNRHLLEPAAREALKNNPKSLRLQVQQKNYGREAMAKLSALQGANGVEDERRPETDVDVLQKEMKRVLGDKTRDTQRLEELRRDLQQQRALLWAAPRFRDEVRAILEDLEQTGTIRQTTLHQLRSGRVPVPRGGARGIARRAQETYEREGYSPSKSVDEVDLQSVEDAISYNLSLSRWLDKVATSRLDWRTHVEKPVQLKGTWKPSRSGELPPNVLTKKGRIVEKLVDLGENVVDDFGIPSGIEVPKLRPDVRPRGTPRKKK
mmetsp:Transcript_6903/g.26654  ORF Transcript_6903/g.26654 Transcript_6903/m.26654 type:complete len:660 (-) Transcript_6903:13-1992(-)